MGLEARRADTGIYGTNGSTYDWKADGSATTGPALIPQFIPKGNSQMNFSVLISNAGLGYTITVTDPSLSNAAVLSADQTGSVHLDTAYNK